jgi:hypothetical protein
VEGLTPSRTSLLRPRRCSWCWRCRRGTGGAGGLSLRPPSAPCPCPCGPKNLSRRPPAGSWARPRGGAGALEGLAPSRVPPLRPRRCSWCWRRRGGTGGAGGLPLHPVLVPSPCPCDPKGLGRRPLTRPWDLPRGGTGAAEGLAPSRAPPPRPPRRCSWRGRRREGRGGAGPPRVAPISGCFRGLPRGLRSAPGSALRRSAACCLALILASTYSASGMLFLGGVDLCLAANHRAANCAGVREGRPRRLRRTLSESTWSSPWSTPLLLAGRGASLGRPLGRGALTAPGSPGGTTPR